MRVILERLVLFNFKSFYGEVIIGALQPFTAIIGANGSGKSNLMDAISFVMGEKAKSLRVKQLKELIYGASTGTPRAERAFVAITFAFEDSSKQTFTRSISGMGSEYKIDDQVVAAHSYLSELEKLNLNVKTKNFLVFQGTVESIIMKTPKEYAQMFEEISNTVTLKTEYERLKHELSQAENELIYTYKTKKDIEIKKKYASLEKKDADKYEKLHDQYISIKTKLQLFELYHFHKNIEDLIVIQNTLDLQINEQGKEKKIPHKLLKQKKTELETLLKKSEDIEIQLREAENVFGMKQIDFVEIKEKILYWQGKLNSTNLLLRKACECDEAHIETIRKLENELLQVEEIKATFEENMSIQLLSQGSSIELNRSQVEKYYHLKQIAELQSSESIQLCKSLKQKQSSNQNKLDNENRKKVELKIKLHQKNISKDEIEKSIGKIQQNMQETENLLINKTKEKHNLETMITQQKNDVESIQSELQCLSEELGNAQIDKHLYSRLNREAETLNTLKEFFPGVHGRLYNLCKAIHSRYNIAMTKVFGKHCNSIIVSTNKVAMQCIHYLREQRIGTETFLPLDSLKVKPIKESLRGIIQSKHAKLLYDVLEFSPKEICQAVLFVTKDTIVCETAEDAQMIAYESHPQQRRNCISLDGIYYMKNGFISGGRVELVQKARIWQQKDLVELNSRKMTLREKLREKFLTSQTSADTNTLDIEIRSITNRLSYCKLNFSDAEKKTIALQNEIKVIENELKLVNNNITGIEGIMEEINTKILNVQKTITNTEATVFANFCKDIGISNICQYEQREFRVHQEQTTRKIELEDQCDRIKNSLEFEKSRDTKSKIFKVKKNIDIVERELREARQIEVLRKNSIEEESQKLNCLRATYDEAKNNVAKQEMNINELRHEIGLISKKIKSTQRERIVIVTELEKKMAQCHAVIRNSKTEDIVLPLLSSDIGTSENLETSASSNSQLIELRDTETLSRLDFSVLSNDMKSKNVENIELSKSKLVNEIAQLQDEMKSLENPNFKAGEKINALKEKLTNINLEYEEARAKVNALKKEFEIVKKKRYDKFVHCFDQVTGQLDIIYKALVKDNSVHAVFLPDNPEEPYLGGINFSCIPAGKRFQLLSNLSGGEKTIAALALLFAIHSYKPAPVFVLDEIDAALDNINIRNVADFIRSKTGEMQFIIISLAEKFFSKADCLVGVCLDVSGLYRESLAFTLSLKEYSKSGTKLSH